MSLSSPGDRGWGGVGGLAALPEKPVPRPIPFFNVLPPHRDAGDVGPAAVLAPGAPLNDPLTSRRPDPTAPFSPRVFHAAQVKSAQGRLEHLGSNEGKQICLWLWYHGVRLPRWRSW